MIWSMDLLTWPRWCFETRNYFHQGGFSGAIFPHQSDFICGLITKDTSLNNVVPLNSTANPSTEIILHYLVFSAKVRF